MNFLSLNFSKRNVNPTQLKTRFSDLELKLKSIKHSCQMKTTLVNKNQNFTMHLLRVSKDKALQVRFLIFCCILNILRITTPIKIINESSIRNFMRLYVTSIQYFKHPNCEN